MTINAIVKTLDAGYDSDREAAAKAGFEIGNSYVVEDVDMGQSHTTIRLAGFNRGFNSVFFTFEEDGEFIDIYRDSRFNPYL